VSAVKVLNAHLIEAAPKLLEALQELKRLYGDREDYVGEYKSAWDKANSIIKQALGK
jgi:hypothetical protein